MCADVKAVAKCPEPIDELPTTVTKDGFEATEIAGDPNKHLNVRKAMKCVIERSYFVKDFQALSTEDQDALIEATDIRDYAILATYVMRDFSGIIGMLAYAIAKSVDQAQEYSDNMHKRVIGNMSKEQQRAWAIEVDEYYRNEVLPALEAMD